MSNNNDEVQRCAKCGGSLTDTDNVNAWYCDCKEPVSYTPEGEIT